MAPGDQTREPGRRHLSAALVGGLAVLVVVISIVAFLQHRAAVKTADQRDAARAALADTRKSLGIAKTDLAATKDDLSSTQSDLSTA